MTAFSFEFLWKIYDSDAVKGAFLHTDATSCAERFNNDGFPLVLIKLDSLDPRTDGRAVSHARLIAFFGLASVSVYDCDTNHCRQLENDQENEKCSSKHMSKEKGWRRLPFFFFKLFVFAPLFLFFLDWFFSRQYLVLPKL